MAESEAELTEIPANEILDKIQKGEPIEYAHVIIKGELDVNKLDLPKENEKFLVNSPIRVTNSQIDGFVDFGNTIFSSKIKFESTHFGRGASFYGATFSERADFSRATFSEYADFSGATFKWNAAFFNNAAFSGRADFSRATFRGITIFIEAAFNEGASFKGATFNEGASFIGATFKGFANFDEDQLKYLENADFRHARRKLIGFRTNKEWNITDLQTFVTCVSDIYNVFLAQIISKELEINFAQAFQNIEEYSNENQLLKVYRIKMGSPGGFGFLGIPEVIEQIRKTLIWWYHERSLNELERAEKCLDLIKKYIEMHKLDNVEECIDDLIKKICKDIKIFEKLESSGKLEKVTENLDYMPRESEITENENALASSKAFFEPNYKK